MLSIACEERGIQYTSTEDLHRPSQENFRPSALKIVVFREPRSRVLSHYWQLVPHDGHKGGSNKHCSAAAKISFRQFLSRCRHYSSNFMTRYHAETIANNLHKFDLVIPYEYYNEGLLMLHLFAGFSVKNILYVNKKNVSHPELKLSSADERMLQRYNYLDA